MAQTAGVEALVPERPLQGMMAKKFAYDYWMEKQDVPIHTGYYVEDLRTIEVAPWKLRNLKTAFVQLMGMEGINELRVSELGPGETSDPFKFGLDEIVYVLEGRGITTVWSDEDNARKSFEWGPRSLFFLPRHFHPSRRAPAVGRLSSNSRGCS